MGPSRVGAEGWRAQQKSWGPKGGGVRDPNDKVGPLEGEAERWEPLTQNDPREPKRTIGGGPCPRLATTIQREDLHREKNKKSENGVGDGKKEQKILGLSGEGRSKRGRCRGRGSRGRGVAVRVFFSFISCNRCRNSSKKKALNFLGEKRPKKILHYFVNVEYFELCHTGACTCLTSVSVVFNCVSDSTPHHHLVFTTRIVTCVDAGAQDL